MSIYSRIRGRSGASGFGYASTAEEVTEGLDLSGKTALVTGVNSGLGQETARVLAMRGAHILAVARTMEKAQKAALAMPDVTPLACELSSPQSVRSCVEEVKGGTRKIDILICNAGIMALPRLEQEQGCELQFFTNHIGHFILTTGLLDSLTESARVVMLSSEGHRLATRGLELDNLSGEKHYFQWRAYGRSKLANLLFAVELSRRFEGSKRTANAVHPGVIRTNLGRHMGMAQNAAYSAIDVLISKNIPQGAATTCYVATNPGLAATSGAYFSDCNLAKASRKGRDAKAARRLWEVSEEIAARVV
jgi:WW domain-containing oxidoreductase